MIFLKIHGRVSVGPSTKYIKESKFEVLLVLQDIFLKSTFRVFYFLENIPKNSMLDGMWIIVCDSIFLKNRSLKILRSWKNWLVVEKLLLKQSTLLFLEKYSLKILVWWSVDPWKIFYKNHVWDSVGPWKYIFQKSTFDGMLVLPQSSLISLFVALLILKIFSLKIHYCNSV